jgi:leucyl aminopeptidase
MPPSVLPNPVDFRHTTGAIADIEAGRDDRLADLGRVDAVVGGEWSRATAGEFSGRAYEHLVAKVVGQWKARHLCFIAAGNRSEVDGTRWRRVAAACSYLARERRVNSCAWLVREGLDVPSVAMAVADGLSAAEFHPGRYKTDPDGAGAFPPAVTIVAPGADEGALSDAVRRGRTIGRAANMARELANEPPNILTPRAFATRIESMTRAAGLSVDVLHEDRLNDLGMRLLLAVAQGSAESAHLVVIRHDPPGAPETPVVGFVGKGVTFDTGGISIKPADSMDRMKHDMTGAASVVSALCAAAELKVPCRLIGVVPIVENMPGGRAVRPGDVVASASGKTVEIVNTDAEGRLILADALWYAQQLGATHLVDVATLTGSCMIALGRTVSGLMGAPDDWVQAVKAAAETGGDRVWPLPIYEEALDQLRSDIADLSNVGGRPGGAITAAAFLREFTGGRPWAHLDIAGTAWAESKTPYLPKGATGVAVRTLIEVARMGAAATRNRKA